MTVTGAVVEPVDPVIATSLASAQIAIEAAATALDAAQRAVLAVVLLTQAPAHRAPGNVSRGTSPTCPVCGDPESLDCTTMAGPLRLCAGCGHQWDPRDV